jgi:hypothetical protein
MGPSVAGIISAELGIGRILVPRDHGTFSAHRMLMTDAHQEPSLTRITPVAGATTAEFERICKHRDRAIPLVREREPRPVRLE